MVRIGKLLVFCTVLWWFMSWFVGSGGSHALRFRVDVTDVHGTGLSISISRAEDDILAEAD